GGVVRHPISVMENNFSVPGYEGHYPGDIPLIYRIFEHGVYPCQPFRGHPLATWRSLDQRGRIFNGSCLGGYGKGKKGEQKYIKCSHLKGFGRICYVDYKSNQIIKSLSWSLFLGDRYLGKIIRKKNKLVFYGICPILPSVPSRTFDIIMRYVSFHQFCVQSTVGIVKKIIDTAIEYNF